MIIVGQDRYRTPPEDVVRQLREAFGDELFLEWMPKAKRWSVKRRVPWGEVAEQIARGNMTEQDVKNVMQDRYDAGYVDAPTHMVLHAFTIQDRKGKYVEPGSFLIHALQAGDLQPGGDAAVRKVMHDMLDQHRLEEERLNKMYSEGIEAKVEEHDYLLRQLPRMAYPDNPIGKDNGTT